MMSHDVILSVLRLINCYKMIDHLPPKSVTSFMETAYLVSLGYIFPRTYYPTSNWK